MTPQQALTQLEEAIRNQVREEVFAAFSGAMKTGTAKVASPRLVTKPGAKRDPAAIAQLTSDLLAAIKAEPGLRIEQIAKVMKRSTRELNLPVKKLIASKSLKVVGYRRATKYFPARTR